MRIVVDGDSCPVKAEIADTAGRFGVPVLMVASYDHVLQPEPGVEIVQVDRSGQSADLYIAAHVEKGDIVVTQDYGLAALVIARACHGSRAATSTMQVISTICLNAAIIKRRQGGRGITARDRSRLPAKTASGLRTRCQNFCRVCRRMYSFSELLFTCHPRTSKCR